MLLIYGFPSPFLLTLPYFRLSVPPVKVSFLTIICTVGHFQCFLITGVLVIFLNLTLQLHYAKIVQNSIVCRLILNSFVWHVQFFTFDHCRLSKLIYSFSWYKNKGPSFPILCITCSEITLHLCIFCSLSLQYTS